jgi:hypothetical protein
LEPPKKGIPGCINLSTKITKKPLPGKAYSAFKAIGALEKTSDNETILQLNTHFCRQ